VADCLNAEIFNWFSRQCFRWQIRYLPPDYFPTSEILGEISMLEPHYDAIVNLCLAV
jgi:hypothetical protein